MGAVLDDLLARPNLVIKLSDDQVIRAVLDELRIDESLFDEPGLAARGATSADPQGAVRPWVGLVADKDVPSHFLVFVRFSGFAQAQENGYVLYALCKRRLSAAEIATEVRALADNLGAQGASGRMVARPPLQ